MGPFSAGKCLWGVRSRFGQFWGVLVWRALGEPIAGGKRVTGTQRFVPPSSGGCSSPFGWFHCGNSPCAGSVPWAEVAECHWGLCGRDWDASGGTNTGMRWEQERERGWVLWGRLQHGFGCWEPLAVFIIFRAQPLLSGLVWVCSLITNPLSPKKSCCTKPRHPFKLP